MRFPGFTEEWEMKKLGEVADVSKLAGYEFTKHIVYEENGKIIALRGLNIKNNKLNLSDVKFIDNSDFSKLNRSKLYIDDLMFTYIGTIGEVALIEENDRFYLAPNVSRIRSDKSLILPKFLLQYFNQPNFKNIEISKYISSSSQSALTMENVRKFKILLPKLEEQTKISSFLSLIDERIQTQIKIIEQLETLIKGLSEKLFSQEIRFKGFAEKWSVKKLGGLATFYSGGTPLTSKKEYFDGNIPFIRSGEINSNVTEQFINELGLKKSSAKMVEIGDILYALYGATSGEVAISKINGAINQAVLCIKSQQNHYFIYSYLFHKKEYIINKYLQGGQGNLSADIVKQIELPIPTLEEQTVIANFLSAIDTKIQTEKNILEKYQSQKQYLLQNLFI